MGNLNAVGPEAFTKDHHKKGYKELGGTYVRIAIQKGPYCITEPYAWENVYQYGADVDGEYIIWEGDEPIAEFKHLDHAMSFLTFLVEGKIRGGLE